jgi:hypothetical protein
LVLANDCLFNGPIYRDASNKYHAADFWFCQIGHKNNKELAASMTIKSTLLNTLGLIALLPLGVQATPVEWSYSQPFGQQADK